jgi:uncharacterized membrane protein
MAIVWMNHHYLMLYAIEARHRLLWFNFVHLFSMSLLPLSTAWRPVSELAPQPVAFYAAIFFLVNAAYACLIWEPIDETSRDKFSSRVNRAMRLRSIATVCLFATAVLVAPNFPILGLGICIDCLALYLRSDPLKIGRAPRKRVCGKHGRTEGSSPMRDGG